MINFKLTYPDFEALIKKNKRRIMDAIAASMQANRGMLFDAEGAYNGRPRWADLKFRRGMILQDRGTLRNSLAPKNATDMKPGRSEGTILEIGDRKVIIGTSLAIAPVHNKGAVIVPKKAQALKIPLPAGKNATEGATGLRKGAIKSADGKQRFIFRARVVIPARNFGDWNSADQDELNQTLAGIIVNILKEGA